MNEIARVLKKLYLFSFLYFLIFIAGSGIQVFAQGQNEIQKTLEITILDKITDEPVSGAKVNVRVIQDTGGDFREEQYTDENGKCSFAIEDKTIQLLRINAVKNGYTPIEMSLSASDTQQIITTQHTLYFDKGTKIGGLIQDAQGNPIEGVAVSVSLQSSNRNNTAKISGHGEKTDSNGVWLCDIIPEQPETISIRFSDPNYRTETLNVQSPSPVMQLLREMAHVVIMQKQLNLTGQVLDTFGNPIEGALVAQGANRGPVYYPSTKTNSEGNYIFENIKTGEMVLTVQADGFSPQAIRFNIERQMSPVNFHLEPGHTIKGRVIDPNGQPVPGVSISAGKWQELQSLTLDIETDSNGIFVWDSAPADELMINIYKRRYIAIRDYMIHPSEEEYVVTLFPELVIYGSVVDANSGEPINEFRFYPGMEGGEGRDISWKSGLKITNSNDYIQRFTYPSNEYYIRVEAEGYETQTSRLIKPQEGNVVLDFSLQPLEPVTGIVKSTVGKPLANVEVMIVNQQLIIQNGKAGSRPSSDRLSVTTDSDGKFSFFPKTEEYSIVILDDLGYAFVLNRQFTSGAGIRLSSWSKLEGTLKIGDKPGINETIIYNPEFLPQLNGVTFNFQMQTDENGHFVFDRMFSGNGSVARLLQTGNDLQLNTHMIQVNVKPDETKNVQIGGTGRPVTGKIVIPEPIKDRTSWQYIEGNLNITSKDNPYLLISFDINKDGSFRIDDVPEGQYMLYIQAYDLNTRVSQMSNEQIAQLSRQFSIPELPSGRSDEAFDLGELELAITGEAAAGQSLIGKAIPGFEDITIDFNKDNAKGKPVLICFWDYEQRPSRNSILELNKKANELKEKNIEAIAVQIAPVEKATLNNWLEEYEIELTIGTTGANESNVRYNWSIQSLPWFVLSDSEHIIIDEGFGINELDEKIGSLN